VPALDLPVPSVSLPKKAKPETRADEPPTSAQEPFPPTPLEQPSAAQQTATPARSRAPMRKQSFGDPEADPWASPDLHRGHGHASYTAVPAQSNGSSAPPATRTTSQFTTHSAQSNTASMPNTDPPRPSSYGSEGGWGGYAGGLPNPDVGVAGEGFGQASGGDGSSSTPAGLVRSLGGGRIAGTGPEEVVTVTTLAEKEGVFMFQHRNYEVASARRNSKVVRRYSDFVWLLDCLHKRYPFRQLPLLPPKRVASKCVFACTF
jgi:sorting nexin-8